MRLTPEQHAEVAENILDDPMKYHGKISLSYARAQIHATLALRQEPKVEEHKPAPAPKKKPGPKPGTKKTTSKENDS